MRVNKKDYEFLLKIIRIVNRAVKRAQEENRKKDLPNVYVKNSRIIYELPYGLLTTVSPFAN